VFPRSLRIVNILALNELELIAGASSRGRLTSPAF
jgi:hypothetical protein